jgi:sporulation protein YlmC with PRC-barrel domain
MHLSELLGTDVVTTDGRDLGHIHDVRLVQDGPVLGDWGAALRVHEILVGRRSIGTRLGYGRGAIQGPMVLRLLFGRRPPRPIPWSSIREVGDAQIVVELTN